MSWTRKLFWTWTALSAIWVVTLALAHWANWQAAPVIPKPTDNEVYYVITLPWWHYLLRFAINAAVPPAILFAMGWGLTRLFRRLRA